MLHNVVNNIHGILRMWRDRSRKFWWAKISIYQAVSNFNPLDPFYFYLFLPSSAANFNRFDTNSIKQVSSQYSSYLILSYGYISWNGRRREAFYLFRWNYRIDQMIFRYFKSETATDSLPNLPRVSRIQVLTISQLLFERKSLRRGALAIAFPILVT